MTPQWQSLSFRSFQLQIRLKKQSRGSKPLFDGILFQPARRLPVGGWRRYALVGPLQTVPGFTKASQGVHIRHLGSWPMSTSLRDAQLGFTVARSLSKSFNAKWPPTLFRVWEVDWIKHFSCLTKLGVHQDVKHPSERLNDEPESLFETQHPLKRGKVTPAVYPRLIEFLHFDIQSTEQKSHYVNTNKLAIVMLCFN